PPRARRREPGVAGPPARCACGEAEAATAVTRPRAREPAADPPRRAARGAVRRRAQHPAAARGARALHRLAVLLPRLGPEREVPGDPREPGRARALRRRAGAPARDPAGRVAAPARRVRLLAGARGRRRRDDRGQALLLPPPAGRPR